MTALYLLSLLMMLPVLQLLEVSRFFVSDDVNFRKVFGRQGALKLDLDAVVKLQKWAWS